VKDRANLRLVDLLDVWILKDTAHKLYVLLRNKRSSPWPQRPSLAHFIRRG
jgi:hypothetical protein